MDFTYVKTLEKKVPIYYMNEILIKRAKSDKLSNINFYDAEIYESFCDDLIYYFESLGNKSPKLFIKVSDNFKKSFQKRYELNDIDFNCKLNILFNNIINSFCENGLIYSILVYYKNQVQNIGVKPSFLYKIGIIFDENTYSLNGVSSKLSGMSYYTVLLDKCDYSDNDTISRLINDFIEFQYCRLIIDFIKDDTVYITIDKKEDFSCYANLINTIHKEKVFEKLFKNNKNKEEKETKKKISIQFSIYRIQNLNNKNNTITSLSSCSVVDPVLYLSASKSIVELSDDHNSIYDSEKSYSKFQEKLEPKTLIDISYDTSGICSDSIESFSNPNETLCGDTISFDNISEENYKDKIFYNYLIDKGTLKAWCKTKENNEKFGPMCENYEPKFYDQFLYHYTFSNADTFESVYDGYLILNIASINLIKKPKNNINERKYLIKHEMEEKEYKEILDSNLLIYQNSLDIDENIIIDYNSMPKNISFQFESALKDYAMSFINVLNGLKKIENEKVKTVFDRYELNLNKNQYKFDNVFDSDNNNVDISTLDMNCIKSLNKIITNGANMFKEKLSKFNYKWCDFEINKTKNGTIFSFTSDLLEVKKDE